MKRAIYTQRVEVVETYKERRDCADQRIAEFIWKAGFLPVPVPNNNAFIDEFVNEINPSIIVLVGGNSLVKYGGNAPERDETDENLLNIAVERRIPLYGFCRGMQSILNFFGNELVAVDGHVAVHHDVVGEEKSINVNSYHNQGCMELKNEQLTVVLRSRDGVVEKIKHRSLPIVGTMWHPERENPFRAGDLMLLKKLLEN